MTTDQAWTDVPSVTTDPTPPDLAGLYPEHPVHVKVVETLSQRNAPEFAGWRFFTLIAAGAGNPVQIAQRRYHRFKMKTIWTIPATTTVFISNTPDSLSTPIPAPTIFQVTGPLTAWALPDYDAEQPVYAVFTGTGPVTVAVMDESYGTVQ